MTQAYLWLTGQKSGAIKGSVTQKGREGSIRAVAVSHAIVSPRDPGSGLPTGKRQHKPLVITKELDCSTPLLFNALCTNENLSKAELKFFLPVSKSGMGLGTETMAFEIKLTNANVASIDSTMLDVRLPEDAKLGLFERVSFTYQKIEWTWTEGGILAMDDWESGV